ncbi:hypothetical protein A2778_03935 [Candidatus Daviesbacteria bacterium RIFCSPHIGHO2_01_FULL_40_24]|nr:MAG: hypothetical protein A2778_03935 [Candidatus Daviesbacteria bacterium RIFCSPHIGHO2_01_FULL_40_24]OGE30192.1 MAG: hypothetical protein A3C29_02185 [Candidatus Daviesbacteria bacterium RIFCSPHIGHO2_02_FULL_40_16]OGE43373.1 MAG: hypothetical protein A3A53_01925 [Candidatus Daviesbacteria bacterium RIFCSPLOWO2_01_FULL_39_23]OGE67645.1 MAG: hypothetical protein A3J16_01805 [Candidatus Daviesbacteria bacterium RIFCSPLOWO2_02_FULL_39_13]
MIVPIVIFSKNVSIILLLCKSKIPGKVKNIKVNNKKRVGYAKAISFILHYRKNKFLPAVILHDILE